MTKTEKEQFLKEIEDFENVLYITQKNVAYLKSTLRGQLTKTNKTPQTTTIKTKTLVAN